MSENEIARELARAPLPQAAEAEERAWNVVASAFAERSPAERRRAAGRRYLKPALALALLSTVLAIALTPPGEAVAEWVADAIDPRQEPSRPALTALPADGRLLVTSSQGAWVVQRDGSKRRLGHYDGATWSPRGLFVAATRGRQLVALEPTGAIRWALARPRRISAPLWSPDGFRIAYSSAGMLRVVAGDGTNDKVLAWAGAGAPASWRPGASHELAYADPNGRVSVIATDSGRRLWRSPPRTAPEQLLWTPDGQRLISVSRRAIVLFGARGRPVERIGLPAGAQPTAAAIDPSGGSMAVALTMPATESSLVAAYSLGSRSRMAQRLFVGRGSFDGLAWSPSGRWLLVSWPAADQWLFVRAESVPRVRAISNVGAQFDPGGQRGEPFPRIAGWCCAQATPSP